VLVSTGGGGGASVTVAVGVAVTGGFTTVEIGFAVEGGRGVLAGRAVGRGCAAAVAAG
jgi:hypothetical protein